VVDPKRIIGKNGGLRRRRGTSGRWHKKGAKKVYLFSHKPFNTFKAKISLYQHTCPKIWRRLPKLRHWGIFFVPPDIQHCSGCLSLALLNKFKRWLNGAINFADRLGPSTKACLAVYRRKLCVINWRRKASFSLIQRVTIFREF
jgi:hypothetical protein